MTRPGRSRLSSSANPGPLWIDALEWKHSSDAEFLFQDEGPIELEIGCGLGLFLMQEAAARPNSRFIGIELANKVAQVAALRCHRAELANVRILTADARKLLPFIPDARLAAVHIYFPDPWWKRRHRKRRIVAPDVIAELERVIAKGGILNLATDVDDYFSTMQSVLEKFPTFAQDSEQLLDDITPNHLTNFERKFRSQGKRIWRTRYFRLDAPRREGLH